MRYLIALLFLCTPALAEQPCSEANKVNELLSKDYGEKPFIEMDDNYGRHLVIYLNASTLSWTAVSLDKEKKIICAVSAGTNFKPANLKEFFGDPS